MHATKRVLSAVNVSGNKAPSVLELGAEESSSVPESPCIVSQLGRDSVDELVLAIANIFDKKFNSFAQKFEDLSRRVDSLQQAQEDSQTCLQRMCVTTMETRDS